MKYSSIFRDTYYTTTANSLTYRIELDGDIIYYGRAIKFPGADILKININKVCRDYLSSNINLILGGASAQTNENALRTFNLIDVTTGNILEQYTFLYDWNYVELWTGQTQNRYYKEGETPETNYITVSPASLNSIPSTGGTFTIVVNSNVPWRTNAVGVYPTTGNAGSTTVRITVGENPYDTRFSGSKTFYMVGDTSVSATFKYFQDAESTTGTTVDIYPTTLDNIPETGGTYTITVYSNGDWRTDVPSWVTVTPQTGSGNGTITLVVAPNNGTARQGSITVLTDNDMASVIVSQDASTQTDYITVSPSEIRNIPASGGTYYVNLFSNVAWKKRFADQNIVPSAGTAGNYTIAITVPVLDNPDFLDAKYYYRFVKQGDTSIEAVVTAYQDSIKTLTVEPEVLTNAESGGTTYTINITTTEDWTVSVPEWATVSASSGTGNGSITVTVSDNSGSTRSGNVVIETSNSNKTLSITQYGETVDTSEYFTVEFVSGGSINFAAPSSGDSLTMYYSKNGSAWTNITSSLGSVETLYGNTGDVIRFKGTDYFRTYWVRSTNGIIYNNSQDSTTKVKIYGNIMSTIYGDDFSGQTTASNYMFEGCFRNLNVVDASRLVLPSTTLAERCYAYMFYGCKYLAIAPQLPATTLAYGCYMSMFDYCTSLIQAPVLPATTLARACYQDMFGGCNSLETAPVLPATTLALDCYNSMFASCSGLTTAPALPATTLAGNCYSAMFNSCNSLTTAPELPATTLANLCYQNMFYHCSSLTTAPELPATTLTEGCYAYMFAECTSLNYIKCLATDISATNCTSNWTKNVASAGTFVKDSAMSDWTTGIDGIPTNWIVENEGEIDYSTMPLTFEILSDGVINWKTTNTGFTKTIEYKLNDGEWTSITSSTGGTSISVVSGDTVQFRGDNAAYTSNDKNLYRNSFGLTTQFNIYGNIMSLIDSTNFSTLTTLSSDRTFYQFFYGCNVIDASNLILPATTLTYNCYDSMFNSCRNLVNAPALPATTLAGSCYWSMFRGCTSLTTAPELPVTTLTDSCYSYMFYNCTSLTTAPALPATTLVNSCYRHMFEGCTSLETAPVLPATTLVGNCYERMFYNCSSLNYIKCLATDISAGNCTNVWVYGVAASGTFVKDPNMNSWSTGDSGIPSGWTIENNS